MADEKQRELEDAINPIHEWLCKYGHPHMKIIVNQEGAEVLEAVCGVPLNPPD